MKTIFSFIFLSFSLSAFAELPEFCKPRVEEVAKDFKSYKELHCDEDQSSDVLFIKEMKKTYVENLGRECHMEVLTGKKVRHDGHLETDIHNVDFVKEAGEYFEKLIEKQD